MLRQKVILNTHCYETYDLESLVKLSKEFNFKITAFHHALEAWLVPDLLKDNNISAAIFADHWGYKKVHTVDLRKRMIHRSMPHKS
jgi:hypothetical protein